MDKSILTNDVVQNPVAITRKSRYANCAVPGSGTTLSVKVDGGDAETDEAGEEGLLHV